MQYLTYIPRFPSKVRLAPWKSCRYAIDAIYNAPPSVPTSLLAMKLSLPCTSITEASTLHGTKTKPLLLCSPSVIFIHRKHTLTTTERPLFALNTLNPLKLSGTFAVLTAPPLPPSLLMNVLKKIQWKFLSPCAHTVNWPELFNITCYHMHLNSH